MTEERSLPELDWFHLRENNHSRALLTKILRKKVKKQEVNHVSDPITDKTGRLVFFFGWRDPGSSRSPLHVFAVRLNRNADRNKADAAIKVGLAWEAAE